MELKAYAPRSVVLDWKYRFPSGQGEWHEGTSTVLTGRSAPRDTWGDNSSPYDLTDWDGTGAIIRGMNSGLAPIEAADFEVPRVRASRMQLDTGGRGGSLTIHGYPIAVGKVFATRYGYPQHGGEGEAVIRIRSIERAEVPIPPIWLGRSADVSGTESNHRSSRAASQPVASRPGQSANTKPGMSRMESRPASPFPRATRPATAPADQQEIEARKHVKLQVRTDGPDYFIGENILLHYGLTNEGTEPVRISRGGDYRASRALRFKVVATDAEGRKADDPDPWPWCEGGLEGDYLLKPGETSWQSIPLMRYCDFDHDGVYRIQVYHDLGWEGKDRYWFGDAIENLLPVGAHNAPIGEVTIKLVMPTEARARQVVERMLTLPAERYAHWGE